MPRLLLLLLLLVFVVTGSGCSSLEPVGARPQVLWSFAPVFPANSAGPSAIGIADGDDDEEDSAGPIGIGWAILWYIPNRVLDAFDMVRARLRLGPGFAADARATQYADVFVGTYATVYIGLPGPRGRKFPRLPVGLESKSGAEVSVVDVTLEGGLGPDYGKTEIGLGFQLAVVGIDLGVDPMEIFDFVVGFAGFDPQDDDY